MERSVCRWATGTRGWPREHGEDEVGQLVRDFGDIRIAERSPYLGPGPPIITWDLQMPSGVGSAVSPPER